MDLCKTSLWLSLCSLTILGSLSVITVIYGSFCYSHAIYVFSIAVEM